MSKLFLATISLLLILVESGKAQENFNCYNSEFRLRNSIDDVQDIGDGRTYESTSGLLEVCVNGSYTTLCGGGEFNETEIAKITCQYLGYYDVADAYVSFAARMSDYIIDYVDCPEFSYDFSSCDIEVTYADNCPLGNDLTIVCARYGTSPSYCYNDLDTQLDSNVYFGLNNGGSFQSGFPLVCLNNTLRPYCLTNSTEQQQLANNYCGENGVGTVDPLFGDASDYMLSFTTDSSVDYAVCSNYSDVSSCDFSLSESCSLDSYNLVTCYYSPSTCNEGELFSVNQAYMSYTSSRTSRTSRVETCTGTGERIDVCNDGVGSIDESVIQVICSSQGFSNNGGSIVEYDETLYGYANSGLYATDIYCEEDAYNFADCNYTVTSQCSGTPLTVMCNSECQFGSVRLYNEQTGYNINGSLAITGILEVCVGEGGWATFCDEGVEAIDSNLLGFLQNGCNSMGYAGGERLSADPAIYGLSQSSVSLTNVQCSDPYGFYSCNYNISENEECILDGYSYLLQCVVQDQPCSPFSLQSRSTSNINFAVGNSYDEGYPEACSPEYNYGSFCADILDDDLATLICMYNGYTQGYANLVFGSEEDFHPTLTRNGVNNYTCPDYAYSISDCQLNFTTNIGCTEDGGAGVITCLQEQSSCSNSIRLSQSGSGDIRNNDYIYIGNAEVCVNETYVPICSNLLTEDLAQLVCYNEFGSDYVAYPFPIIGDRSTYAFNAPKSDIGVFELNCTYDMNGGYCNYDTLSYTDMDGCSLYGGHSIISCYFESDNTPLPPADDCSYTGQVRLSNQYAFDNEFGNGIGGVIEICVNGTYTRVCVNDTFSNVDNDTLATFTCNQLGYPTNSLNFVYPSFYPFGDSSVVNSLTCPDFANDLSACSFETTNDGVCASHDYDANLQCFNISLPVMPDCFVDGQVRLANRMSNNYTDSQEISGGLEICVNGSYHRVCNANDTMLNRTVVLQQACEDLGYGDGYIYAIAHSSTPSIDYISCPVDFLFSLTQCNYSTTDNGTCVDPLNGIYLTCTRTSTPPTCDNGQVRIDYNITTNNSDYETISGILEICVDGQYQQVCGSDAANLNATTIVEAACNDIGYSNGSSFSLTYPPSTIIDSYSCPDSFTSLAECSFYTTDNGSCVNANNSRIDITCRRDFPVCADGDVRFYNNYTDGPYKNGQYITESIQGALEICYNGTYYGVCSGDYDQLVAEATCTSLGYNGNTTNSTENGRYGAIGINNITCPDNFTSLSQCSFGLSNSSFNDQCYSHSNDLSARCERVTPACSGDLYRYANQSTLYFNNNTRVNSGRLEVCLDGEYVPVCDSGFSDDQLSNICDQVAYGTYDYLPGQYIGSLYDYQTNTTSTVVQTISCPQYSTSITQCQYTTTYGCPSYEQVLTCFERSSDNVCSENDIRLSNFSQTTLPFYSRDTYSGRVEVCRNGEFVDVCNNTYNAQYFAQRACSYFSSGYTSTIIPYDSEYSTALSNRSFTVDNNCTNGDYNIDYGLDGCNVTDNDNVCPSNPLAVNCETECSNFGGVRLQQTNVTNFDNGTAAVSGILQFCDYNTWRTVCENNYTDVDYNQFCVSLGYNNGTLLFSNPGGDLMDDDPTFVNLSCPMYNYYSPQSCSIEYGDNTDCDLQVNLYCYNAEVQTCSNEEVRVGNNYYQPSYASGRFSNGTRFQTSYVEVCTDGSFRLLCNDNLDVQVASQLCYQSTGFTLGYPGALYGSLEDYLLPSTSNGIYDINCNNITDRFNVFDCSFSTNAGCSANGGPALVTCVDIRVEQQPSCSGSRFSNGGYGTFSNGTSFNFGFPEICADGMSYSPICGELTEQEAVLFCSDASGQYGASTNPPYGNSSDYLINNDATTVITQPYCPPDRFYEFYLGNCNYTLAESTNGCYSYEPQPLITCYQAPQPCQEGTVNFIYLESEYSSNTFTAYFSLQYCSSSETYATVCSDGITGYEASLFCRSQGYTNGYIADRNFPSYYYNPTNDYLFNFTCNSDNVLDCMYDFTDGDNCSDYSGDIVFACYNDREEPLCYPGQVTLFDEYEYEYNGDPDFPLVTGYPAVCINNTFVPFCDTAGGGLFEARTACAFATNFTFGFTGSVDEYYTPYPLVYNESLIVTNISCDIYGNCNYNSSNTTTCEEFATVTCGIICNENETRLYNERFAYTDDGLERVSGVPQVCSGGGWLTVCNDGTNDDALPTAICQQDYGYRYGRLLPRDEAQLYGPNPRGTIYLSDSVCPEIIDDYMEDCDSNFTICDNEIYAIECFNHLVCVEGDIRLADSQELTTASGMEYTSGYPVICVDDQLVPLCNSVEFGLFELTTICLVAENRTYGFPGTPESILLYPFTDVNTTLIATDLDCGLYDYDCTNTTKATSMGCSNYGGYAEITCAVVCEDGDRRLYNEESYYTEDGLLRVTGTPQTCENGGWTSICDDGSNADNLPNLICEDAGLTGGYKVYSNSTSGPGTFYISNVTCIESVENCNYIENYSEECLSGEYDYAVECYNYRICVEGDIRLADSQELTTASGMEYTSGYPVICVDDQLVPLCNSVEFGLFELTTICLVAENRTYGFPGTPESILLYPFTDVNTTLIATDLDCGLYDYDCTNTTKATSMGCSNYGGYAEITCAVVCEDGDRRLYNEESYYTEDGLLRVTGTPQTCENGGWTSICDDGSNADNLPNLICEDAGLTGGYKVYSNSTSGPGTFYISNVTCIESVENCNYIENYSEECLSGEYDYAVECYNYRICVEGDIRLADSQELTTASGMEYTSGYPVICVDDQLVPLCNSVEFGLFELTTICLVAENRTYGFPGTPESILLYPFTDVNTTLIATDLDCGLYDYDCTNTTKATSMGCSNYGGYAEITCAVVCEDGDRRLYNEESYYTEDGLLRVTGTPQTCENGGWTSICDDGSNADNLPNLICEDAGLTGGYKVYSNSTSGPGTFYISNVTCIESVENCNYIENYSEECLSGEYDYAVECYNYRNCLPRSTRLVDSSTITTNEGFIYISGYPLACVNDQLLPLCNSTMPGVQELTYICQNSTNLIYGFPGTPSFLTVQPFNDADVTYVVTDFSCNLDSCNNGVVHSDDGCANNGGYAIITCADACVDNTFRLYNSMTTYTSDGLLRVTGIPQKCENGGYTSICTSGTVDPDIPDLICQELGYQNGVMVPFSGRSSPPGTFYITNITCGNNTLESCTSVDVYSDECLNGDLEYTVQCYNIRTSPMIVQVPNNISIVQGNSDSVNFTCQFNGDPNPNVQWRFTPLGSMSSVLVTTHDISTSGVDPVTTTLTISPPTLANAGIYTCIAANGAPIPAIGSALLQVVVTPGVNLISTDTTNTIEDESFTFTCIEAGAFPALPIVWNKDATTVLSSSRITITSTTAQDESTGLYTVQSVLTISTLVLSDSGTYTCRTSLVPLLNQPVLSPEIMLNVQVRNECLINAPNNQDSPCVNGYCIDGTNTYFCQCFDGFTGTNCDQAVTVTSPPVFVTQPSEEAVLLGDRANFSCIVTGEPQPSITWRKDGTILTDEKTPYLIIASVETGNRGFYSCEASNSEGTITSGEALLRITNVAQFTSTLTISSDNNARRKRQIMINNELVEQARGLAIGREVSPGVTIVALDAYLINGEIQIVYTVRAPVTEDGRPNTAGVTDGLNSFADEVSAEIPALSFSPVVRFDGCLPESTIVFGNVQLTWPEIGTGENATLPCPCGDISDTTGLTATRMCQGDFVSISEWSAPYDEQCQYDDVSKEICIAAAIENLADAINELLSITGDSDTFGNDAVLLTLTLSGQLADNVNLTYEDASNVIAAMSNLNNVPSATLNNESTTRFLETITSVAVNIPVGEDGTASITQSEITIRVQVFDRDNFDGSNFAATTNADGVFDENGRETTASLAVPETFLTAVSNIGRLVFAAFANDNLFVQSSSNAVPVPVVSTIVSFDAISDDGQVIAVENLDDPISITFVVIPDSSRRLVCAFFDTELSIWSQDGCTTNIVSDGLVCECDHLSSFAVVEEEGTTSGPSEPTVVEEYNAEPILIVGAAVAIVIVLIAVISHLVSSSRYQKEGRIIICSHICLIILYVVLILATVATYVDNEGFCGTFSGLFHYMSLVYVLLIFAEALFYVIKLRHGIGGNWWTRGFVVIMLLASFGIPIVIVIASVAAGYDYYALDNAFCRPQSYPFYYGYIIPMAVISVAALVCIVVGCVTILLVPMKGAESSFRKQSITPHLFAHSILSVVIFIAWIFGLVGTDSNILGAPSTATQYIFGFMLIIHAIVLLILTLLRTEAIRKMWLNLLNRITGRSGKYDFAADDTPRSKGTSKDAEVIGLGQSGQFSREGSIKKKDLNAEDVTPLSASPDGIETQQVDTNFSSKAEEEKVEEEEERKRQKEKEIEENVISNPSASDDDEENDKKTDL